LQLCSSIREFGI